MREHDGKGARVEAMGDPTDSPTAGQNEVTPASVTPAKPLPWRLDTALAELLDVTPWHPVVVSADDKYVAETRLSQTAEQDAEYIVRAANAFPDLLVALKALKGSSCFCPYGIGHPSYSWHSHACINATVAIATAEANGHD